MRRVRNTTSYASWTFGQSAATVPVRDGIPAATDRRASRAISR